MRTKSFGYNTVSTAILQIVTMAAGFITPRIMLTVYGSEINGLVTSITQFVSYFSLVEAGLAGAAVYELYKPLAEKNKDAINSILSAAKKYYNISGYIFVALVFLLAFTYPYFVKTDCLTKTGVGLMVLICGFTGAMDFFTLAKYRVLLTADQKIFVLSYASILSVVVNTVLIVILALNKVDILLVKAVALNSVFLRSFILWLYVKNKYAFVNYTATPNVQALHQRWAVLYLRILGSVQTAAPIVIATIFTTLKDVSVYSIYNMIVGGVSGVLEIFTSGLSSSFGDVIAKKEIGILQKAYQEFEYSYYMILSWVSACAFILLMPFITIYTRGVSDTNYYLPLLGMLFILNGMFYNLKTPQGMLVISAGMFKATRIQTTLQGVIAIVGSLIFVQYWGLAGILCGAILSNIYRTIDLLFYVPARITKLSYKRSLFRMIRVFICFGLSIAPFYSIKLTPQNYFDWFLISIGVGIYVFVVVGCINAILEFSLFRDVFKRISMAFKMKPA